MTEENQDRNKVYDDFQRVQQMDTFAVQAWSQMTIKALHELRDKLIEKRDRLSKESETYIKELDKNLYDLDAYIIIRENREKTGNTSNVIV